MPGPRRRGRRRDVLVGMASLVLVTAKAATAQEQTLHELAARGDVARIARAIEAGEPVDQRDRAGQTALHVAAKNVHLFAVMMLIAKGADPNAHDGKRRTPLHLAADGERPTEGERFQIVELLIAKGADLRARDADGNRPVDYARVKEFVAALRPPGDVTSPPASRRSRRGSP